MKKRLMLVVSMVLAALMIFSSVSFAADGALKIESTTPEDGATNTTKDNMCVKVFFNNEVGNEASKEANEGKFRIVDEEGNEYATKIYYNDEDPTYTLIAIDTTEVSTSDIPDSTTFTCIIDADFQDNDGNTLGEEQTISFTTLNQRRNTLVYMVMMMIMMVAMFAFSAKSALGKPEEENEEPAQDGPFNPYKEAKRTGKSVEEVIAQHEKDVEKANKKNARKNKKNQGIAEKDALGRHGNAYRVHQAQPISKAGSSYKTGRKAIAEAEALKREEEKALRKANNYGKNDKNKKRK